MPDPTLQALPAHFLLYGESGTGGSTGAATFPKPMLVFFFDPFGKDVPYLKRGAPSELLEDDLQTPIRQVLSPKGRLLIQVEYFQDDYTVDERGRLIDGRVGAYARFLRRMARFNRDEYPQWRTVVFDSVTFMGLAARKMHQFSLNPNAKDPRQWYGGEKETMEEMLMIRCGSLPMNTVIRMHVEVDKDEVTGQLFRSPAAVGKLGRALPSGYSEVYRTFTTYDSQTKQNSYWWQTASDAQWQAQTHINAPNPCPQDYRALWED